MQVRYCILSSVFPQYVIKPRSAQNTKESLFRYVYDACFWLGYMHMHCISSSVSPLYNTKPMLAQKHNSMHLD